MGTAARAAGWRRTSPGAWFGNMSGIGPGSGGMGGLYLLATYDDDLARVQLVSGGFPYNVASVVIDRYTTANLTNPQGVRGGTLDVVSADTVRVSDYVFSSGIVNTYRMRAYAEGGSLLGTVYAAITPTVTGVWLKSVARPFLNRRVTVVDFSSVGAPARGGILEIAGRRDPVAITEVRGSRNYELVLRAADSVEAEALELVLSFGDVMYLQVPPGCVVPSSMYAWVGDVVFTRVGKHDTEVRYLSLPLTEVAAPAATIVGYTITWAGVQSAWTTWSDLLADPAATTWAELNEYVSAPEDEVVG